MAQPTETRRPPPPDPRGEGLGDPPWAPHAVDGTPEVDPRPRRGLARRILASILVGCLAGLAAALIAVAAGAAWTAAASLAVALALVLSILGTYPAIESDDGRVQQGVRHFARQRRDTRTTRRRSAGAPAQLRHAPAPPPRARPPASPPVSPPEFVEAMEEGQGAGPGAPETLEPTTGRPGAGGHGPPGPAGPTMAGMVSRPDPRTRPRGGSRDALPDPLGALGYLVWMAEWALVRVMPKRSRRARQR